MGIYAGYVSGHQGTTYERRHNIRDKKYIDAEEKRHYEKHPDVPFHIDRTKTHLNVTLVDKLALEDLKKIYDETFQPACDEYDRKNRAKHPERCRGNYFDYIYKHRKEATAAKPCYEWIVQLGDKDITADVTTRTACAEVLKKYVERFKTENPQLIIAGAYLHMDESSPHIHLDYVPVAYSSRGLTVKNSRSLAMKQMERARLEEMKKLIPKRDEKYAEKVKKIEDDIKNDSYSSNPVTRWQDKERAILRTIAQEHGLDVETKKKPTKTEHREQELFALEARIKEKKAEEKRIERNNLVKQKNAEKIAADTIRQGQEEAERFLSEAREEAEKEAQEAFEQEKTRLINQAVNRRMDDWLDDLGLDTEAELKGLVEDGLKYRQLEKEYEYDDD